ncbi:MAG: efflux RND transporter periplasmic adaptor subunit [Candidatus Obscuribacterales bacterium]|nr:efflux RND transporter periplasmic adaptor subunit [Candidatus Obscuribacterales bacterium]
MTLDPRNTGEESSSIYRSSDPSAVSPQDSSKQPPKGNSAPFGNFRKAISGLKLPQKKSSLGAIAAVAAIAIVGSASVAASIIMKSGSTAQAKTAKTVPVATVTVQAAQIAPVPDVLELTGSISATDPLSVGSSAGGLVITQVNVEEGDYVKKGQILATLDSSVMRAQLAAAEARLQGAGASVAKATQPNRPEDIGSFEAAYKQALADVQNRKAMLEQAKASRMLAQNNAARYANLLKEGAVSEMEAQTKSTEASTTNSTVRAAEENLDAAQYAAQQAANRLEMARQGGRKEDVTISRATANESAATVQQIRAQIEQTIVRAPDDGLITKRFAHIGDVSTGGKTLFEMIRRGQIELKAQVSQEDISRLSTGQPTEISDGIRRANGSVFQISPTVDSTTRLGTVRISIPSESQFKTGMFVKGKIVRGNRSALVVPNSAVLADNDVYYVFVNDSGIAKKKPVTIGARVKELAEINSGINPGEQVIVAGAGFLNDQDPIAIGR